MIVAIPAGVGSTAASETERGRVLAETLCSRCHAIGPAGGSVHPEAPQFRDLNQIYPVDQLEEALAEGIVTGHPDMPEIRLEPEDVQGLIQYLISIQER